MDDDFFKRDYDKPHGRDNLFGWTVFILILIGIALTCWFGTYYIFGKPEKPGNYALLKKIGKIDPPKRFDLTKAPTGEFLSAEQLYNRYISTPPLQLQKESDALLRNYLTNYSHTKDLVPYVIGRFNIIDTFELKPTDAFPSGVVAIAEADGFPQVILEHVFTTDAKNVPALRKLMEPGVAIKLQKSDDLSAVINISRNADGRLQLTVVPLLYGTYSMKESTGAFSLEPPAEMDLAGGFPVVKQTLLTEALGRHKAKKTAPATSPALAGPFVSPTPTPSRVELVRLEPTPSPTPVATPLPTAAMAVATPTPTIPVARIAPSAPPVAKAVPFPTTAPTAPPVQPPVPTPTVTVARGVPLQPFIAAQPTPTVTRGGSWQTYAPGQAPAGRVINVPEATRFADEGVGNERIYLEGNFVVTVTSDNRAVLRPRDAIEGNVRIMVEYPSGTTPPTEDSPIARDTSRPFLVRDVIRGADGMTTIYVREITQ